MKYLFYAIVYDVTGNTSPVGSSTSPAKTITTNIQKVTGISINPSSVQTKNIGDTFTITATVSPSDANNKGITWSSSNSGVATVDSSGNVRCLSAGTTTITATTSDGSGVKASLELTVRNPINSLTLDKDQTTILKDGYTSTVTATTDPSNYDGANISWSIADTSIATVSVSGKTATIKSTSKVGQTTLTVLAGGITKTVNVSVVNFTTTTYNYTGSVQQVDLPAGTYKLEVWGAQGGSEQGYETGGKGGYSTGILELSSNTTLYVYVGGKGLNSYLTSGYSHFYGGWNGGGAGCSDNGCNTGTPGGGATDICTIYSDVTLDSYYRYIRTQESYLSRIIVAGGGGSTNDAFYRSYTGGDGGGTVAPELRTNNTNEIRYFATQTSAGYTTGWCSSRSVAGGFGFAAGASSKTCGCQGGGGGGWYGGGAGTGISTGGSGYVYTVSTASNYPSGCRLNSSYYLTNAQTIAGNKSFPNVAGTGNETGHSGNGAAKITPVN